MMKIQVDNSGNTYDFEIVKDIFNDDMITILFYINGIEKELYYNIESQKQVSNIIDGSYFSIFDSYGLRLMVHSYIINGRVRTFIIVGDVEKGITYPIGYDICEHKFVTFPINESGLIDEDAMKNILENEQSIVGFVLESYRKAIKLGDIRYTLEDLVGVDFAFDEYDDVLNNLARKNNIIAETNFEQAPQMRIGEHPQFHQE